MKKIIVYLALSVAFSVHSQEIQWASKLIKFSSDLGGKQNGIKRILGKPDVFPQGGSSPNAWSPKNALDGKEVVEVGFEKPQTIKQIAIFENLNAGCVVKVSVDNGSGKYETVWSRKPNWQTPVYKSTFAADRSYYFGRKRRKIEKAPEVNLNPGIEYIILEKEVANGIALKIEFNFALLHGQKQIDAIGISNSALPIQPTINEISFSDKIQEVEVVPLKGFYPSSPVISKDGKKLIFSSLSDEKEEVFICQKGSDGKWSNPTKEETLSQNSYYNYIEHYGNDFILKGGIGYNKGTQESGYEILKLQSEHYQSQGALKIAAYNNYDETSEATISSDGTILILGIETDFTHGGSDLYFSKKKEDGTYGFLQNMGKMINSAADEGMPQLLSDNKTIVFSTNGFSGYGEYDIYVSYRLDETWKNWSEPQNLGKKINSNDFDGLPFYDERDEKLYFIQAIDGLQYLKHVTIPKSDLMKS